MTSLEFEKEDSTKIHRAVTFSFILFGVSAIQFLMSQIIPVTANVLSWILILLVDIYMLYALYFAASQSDKKGKGRSKARLNKFIPNRTQSIVVFFLLLGVVVLAFATVYLGFGEHFVDKISTKLDAVYISFLSFTTLGFADINNGAQAVKGVMIFQVFSGVFLFLGVFAILISRITTF